MKFGFFGGSSWSGLGLWKAVVLNYSGAKIEALVEEGVVEPAVADLSRDDFSNLHITLLPSYLPMTVGSRWGPRYLLILMPIISPLATLMLDATLKICGAGWRYAGSALFLRLFILGT